MASFAVFVIQIRQAEGSQGLAPLDVQAALSVFIGRRLHAGVVAEDALPPDRYQRFLAGRLTGLDMTWLSTGRPVRLISIRADGGA
jgi:hypothetical protein